MNWLFIPVWSMYFIGALGALYVIIAVVRHYREAARCGLRKRLAQIFLHLVICAALIMIALNPTGLLEKKDEGKASLHILIDASSSMATADVDGLSRLDAVKKSLQENLSTLEDEFDVTLKEFSGAATTVSDLATLEATGKVSDISGVLSLSVSELGSKESSAGVLLLSDGRSTRSGCDATARLALAKSVPLWTVALGGKVEKKDLWVTVPVNEVFAFAGEKVSLRALVGSKGFAGKNIGVDLCKDGKVIKSFSVTGDDQKLLPIEYEVVSADENGGSYEFRVQPLEGESDIGNNNRPVFVRYAGKKARVFLAEGQPHWDSKFLVQIFRNSSYVDLTALYSLGKDRRFGIVSAGGDSKRVNKDLFPKSAEEFSKYDIIILGRRADVFFDAKSAELLKDFISAGGSLIFSRGKSYGGRYSALAGLEPIVWAPGSGGGAVEFTPGGSAVFAAKNINGATPLDKVLTTAGVKPLTQKLAVCDNNIAMAWRRYGQGRVCQLNMGGLWRWGFRPDDKQERSYGFFWQNTVRWLLSGGSFRAGEDIAFFAPRRIFSEGDSVQLMALCRNIDTVRYFPRVRVISSGKVRELPLRRQSDGTFIAELEGMPAGEYSAELTSNIGSPKSKRLTFTILASSVEYHELSADRAQMKRLADLSQGRELDINDISALPEIVRKWRAENQLSHQKIQLWDNWLLALIVVIIFGVEIFLRRREGLL